MLPVVCVLYDDLCLWIINIICANVPLLPSSLEFTEVLQQHLKNSRANRKRQVASGSCEKRVYLFPEKQRKSVHVKEEFSNQKPSHLSYKGTPPLHSAGSSRTYQSSPVHCGEQNDVDEYISSGDDVEADHYSKKRVFSGSKKMHVSTKSKEDSKAFQYEVDNSDNGT